MAFAVAITTRSLPEHRDLAFWMNRTLEELGEVRAKPSADAVHDLRVALRRCRALASAVAEIDPHPDWQALRRSTRKLFRSMGEVRDAQVMKAWLEELEPDDPALKAALLDSLERSLEGGLAKALAAAGRFDDKRWTELAGCLRARLRKIPVEGEAARCLALERLEEAHELHRRALRTESPVPWHELRIALKRLRYTLELLLPSLHSRFLASLKRVQDVLGDVHDLDTLSLRVLELGRELNSSASGNWGERVAYLRFEKLQTYRHLALGGASVWQNWMSGFPKNEWLACSVARIGATRRAMDPKPSKSLAVARIARKLWSELRRCRAGQVFSDRNEKRVLESAARLSGIRCRGKKSRMKSARTFLLKTPVPPGWSFAEWERVAWSIRFQRGSEPSPESKKFATLGAEQQSGIYLLAGILRLAVAAERSGARAGAAIRLANLSEGLLLQVQGVEETPPVAARFAEAKRLLERYLGQTILVQPRISPRTPEIEAGVAIAAVTAIR